MTNTPPQDFIEYIKKLSSEDSGLERQVAIETITTQLRNYEQNLNFENIFTELDPDNLTETTKTIPDYQREVLAEAIKAYCTG